MLQELKDFWCSLPAAFAQQLRRIWSNGWTISWRMNEASFFDCIFGCAGERDSCSLVPCRSLMVFPLLTMHLEFWQFPSKSFPQPSVLLLLVTLTFAARHIHPSKLRSLLASSDLSAIITCLREHSIKVSASHAKRIEHAVRCQSEASLRRELRNGIDEAAQMFEKQDTAGRRAEPPSGG